MRLLVVLLSCLLAPASIVAFVRPMPSSLKLVRTTTTYSPIPLVQAQAQSRRLAPLKDLLGLGPAEIAITLVVALVLFGPETLKSLSKDVGKAAAELKEIPKTFKEGMEEGAEQSQVAKMKAIAAAKKARRDDDSDDEAPTTRPFEG